MRARIARVLLERLAPHMLVYARGRDQDDAIATQADRIEQVVENVREVAFEALERHVLDGVLGASRVVRAEHNQHAANLVGWVVELAEYLGHELTYVVRIVAGYAAIEHVALAHEHVGHETQPARLIEAVLGVRVAESNQLLRLHDDFCRCFLYFMLCLILIIKSQIGTDGTKTML